MQNRNTQPVSYFQHGPKLAGADDNSLSPGQSNHGLLFKHHTWNLRVKPSPFPPLSGSQYWDLDQWRFPNPNAPQDHQGKVSAGPTVKILIQQAYLEAQESAPLKESPWSGVY